MARIKNVSTELLIIGPGGSNTGEPWLPAGVTLVMQPGDEKVLYDEDLETSKGLAFLIDGGKVSLISREEPLDSTGAADVDVAALNENAVLKDGSVAFEANLAMGGFKLTGLGVGTGSGDSVRFQELDLKEDAAAKGAANGYASLDATTKVPSAEISGVIASSDLTNDAALEKTANKDSANGYAGLSASSKVAASQIPISVFTSSAGAGGAATEVMTLTGILSTDTILAVSQSVDGANSLPLLGFNTLANDALTGVWSADPGAGAVIVVSVLR